MPDGSRATYGPGRRQGAHRPAHRPQGRARHRPQPAARRSAKPIWTAADRSRTGRSSTCSSWSSAPTAGKTAARAARRSARARSAAQARCSAATRPTRSRRNVAHHYDLGNELYELFLDDDLQYSCAYFTDPANSLEQAQADKKAHIAAKLAPEAGPARARHRLRLGRDGALPATASPGVDVLGVTLSEEQLKVARQRAADAGVADRVKFELIDYRDARRAVRPDRVDRHVRTCRRRPLRRIFRQVPRAAEAATG